MNYSYFSETTFIAIFFSFCISSSSTGVFSGYLFLGGFATALTGMGTIVAKTLADDLDPRDIIDYIPTGKLIIYFFLIGMAGVLSNIPLNQVIFISFFFVRVCVSTAGHAYITHTRVHFLCALEIMSETRMSMCVYIPPLY